MTYIFEFNCTALLINIIIIIKILIFFYNYNLVK